MTTYLLRASFDLPHTTISSTALSINHDRAERSAREQGYLVQSFMIPFYPLDLTQITTNTPRTIPTRAATCMAVVAMRKVLVERMRANAVWSAASARLTMPIISVMIEILLTTSGSASADSICAVCCPERRT